MIESVAAQSVQSLDPQGVQGQRVPTNEPQGTQAEGGRSTSGADSPEALSLARSAYTGPSTASGPTSAERLLARLDSMDREFVKSMTTMPDVKAAEAGTPEGLMKLSTELLKHQASLTQASIGISMVSAGTTSFRDGVKQVLTQQ